MSIGAARTLVRKDDAMADWWVAWRNSTAAYKPGLLAWCWCNQRHMRWAWFRCSLVSVGN